MAVIRFRDPFFSDPSEQMKSLRREMDRLFSEFFTPEPGWRGSGVFPPVNIYRDQEKFVVTAELPGVDPQKIDISVQGDNLILKGERKVEPSGGEIRYHRRERNSGTFNRVVSLPDRVDGNRVDASYKRGILTLTLPLAEEARPRQIQVKSR